MRAPSISACVCGRVLLGGYASCRKRSESVTSLIEQGAAPHAHLMRPRSRASGDFVEPIFSLSAPAGAETCKAGQIR